MHPSSTVIARVLTCTWLLTLPLSLRVNAQDDPGRFAEEIEAFEAWDQKNAWPADPILFVGSSSIRMWPTAQAFPGLPVINRGFGGSQISDVNYYFDRIVAKYRPRAIVLYAGDNDIAAGETPEQVLQDFQSFVGAVRAKQPETPIIFITIKPSLSRWQLWPKMNRANDLIRAYASAQPNLYIADIATAMLNGEEKPHASLFLEDELHLSEEGYAVWNDVVRSLLADVVARSGE